MKNQIHKIVLTGGPCSGKTSALAILRQTFEDRGINVLQVPESATHLFGGMGVKIGKGDFNNSRFQSILTEFQVAQEGIVSNVARLYREKTIILLDRGLLDSKAYLSNPNDIDSLLKPYGLTESRILSSGYDGIVHMVTAADGAEQYYTLENNTSRTETPEMARDLDERLQNAYVGAPAKLHVIDNSTDFKAKLLRVEKAISSIIGIPQPIERENKYLVSIKDFYKLMKNSRKVEIEQTYLSDYKDKTEEYIRSRAVDGNDKVFFHTLKRYIRKERIKTERVISPEEYSQLHVKGKSHVLKTRHCFFYEKQYFELDFFIRSAYRFGDMAILEIKFLEENQDIKLPDFFEIHSDQTGNPNFRNSMLAVPLKRKDGIEKM
ncbi:AAA family ATPase [Candidatus Gracilibacteria bacterium]|nr:AAA family ATPase [Candidatus Gracilibacteria bacterium]